MNRKFFMAITSHKGSKFRDSQREHLLRNLNEDLIVYYFIGDPSLTEESIWFPNWSLVGVNICSINHLKINDYYNIFV
jgi:hypothetical protein